MSISIKFKLFLTLLGLIFMGNVGFAQVVDLARTTVVCFGKSDKVVMKSAFVLREEVEKRSSIRLPMSNKWLKNSKDMIIVGQESDLPKLPPKYGDAIWKMPPAGKDGYRIFTDTVSNLIIVIGVDPRGTLYGVGKLLRKMEISDKSIQLAVPLNISSTPRYPIRGHQLGYRPKTNAYDAWTPGIYDNYIRDLAIFGANSIEIMPPETDDDLTSVHMKYPAMDMATDLSKICDSYGLDVWVWYPNIGKDYISEEGIARELMAREVFFAKLPRIDAIFVPGGDPGELEPDVMFKFLAKEAQILNRYHPNAKIWVSPQAFKPTKEWFDSFYRHVNARYSWFGGVVYGPWIKSTIEEVRNLVRADVPIRRYPDITHSTRCQYPVPEWDLAFANTLGRECINPRPVDQKFIHNAVDQFASGSISYSEGINDDVNKIIWSGQDWDPETPVIETLMDYSRYFIGPGYTNDFASALFALERNLKGPLSANSRINITLTQFKDMEKVASPQLLANYRFQLALIRAYFDAYIYRRYYHEQELEQSARVVLSSVKNGESLSALTKAKKILLSGGDKNLMSEVKERAIVLADSLYRSIGAQLTVTKHHGREERGNFIDHIDTPVSDAAWLTDNINRIEKISDESTRIDEIAKMLGRTDPGPGGIYDNFGSYATIGKIQRNSSWDKDPGNLQNSVIDCGLGVRNYRWPDEVLDGGYDQKVPPAAWMTQLTAFYTTPLVVTYNNLDPSSQYKLRVAYTGRFRTLIKLYANEVLIHGFIRTGDQPLYEFPLPKEALKDGNVELKWVANEGERGTQVSELWIIKEK